MIFFDAGRTYAAAPPRCYRRADGKLLGGVAGGLADHLGTQALYVRLAFVGLAMIAGFGIVLYALLWLGLRQEPAEVAAAARPPGSRRRREDLGQLVPIGAVAIGLLILAQTLAGVSGGVLWPLIVGGLGLALLWRQADETQRGRWTAAVTDRRRWLTPLVGTAGWVTVLRSAIGLVLVVAASTWAVAGVGQITQLWRALGAVLIGLVGLVLIVGPMVWRLATEASEERRARIRSQERADMAAHLHDSVLQTLALIQKQAHDQRAVQRLARAQERDLRQWLYGDTDRAGSTVKAGLQIAAAEVEDGHGVPIEVVAVGDAPMSDSLLALVQAAREAMVNAAKHAGAPRIDVYAEVEPDLVEVFVRDRGIGFDMDAIGEDRLGVRRSILERMERHGGTAEVRSRPGEGTEVRLGMRRDPDAGEAT